MNKNFYLFKDAPNFKPFVLDPYNPTAIQYLKVNDHAIRRENDSPAATWQGTSIPFHPHVLVFVKE